MSKPDSHKSEPPCFCEVSNKFKSKILKKKSNKGDKAYSKKCHICSEEYLFHSKCAQYVFKSDITNLKKKSDNHNLDHNHYLWRRFKLFCDKCQTQQCPLCQKRHTGKETQKAGDVHGVQSAMVMNLMLLIGFTHSIVVSLLVFLVNQIKIHGPVRKVVLIILRKITLQGMKKK